MGPQSYWKVIRGRCKWFLAGQKLQIPWLPNFSGRVTLETKYEWKSRESIRGWTSALQFINVSAKIGAFGIFSHREVLDPSTELRCYRSQRLPSEQTIKVCEVCFYQEGIVLYIVVTIWSCGWAPSSDAVALGKGNLTNQGAWESFLPSSITWRYPQG